MEIALAGLEPSALESPDELPIVPDLALNGWSKVSIVGTWASRAVPM